MTASAIPNKPGEQEAVRGIRAQIRVAGKPGVKELVLARASSKLAIAVLSYGGMVFLARQGASDIAVVAVSASGYLAALLFALQGGTLADILPKRWALFLGLATQATLCFIFPTVFGTDVLPLISLLFLISAISQVTTPAMKSAVMLVTTMAEVVAVSALIGLIGAIGSAIGSTFLAPLIIRYSGIRTVMYVAGVVLMIAAFRALRLPPDSGLPSNQRESLFREAIVTPRRLATWAGGMPGVASMVMLGALVVALFEAINALLPVYVRDVLNADPVMSIFIFAPAGLGFLAGTLLTPPLIRIMGERWVAAISFALIASGAILLGSIHEVARYFGPYSPLRIVEPFGVSLSTAILAAGVIVIPTNLGSTMAAGTVQAFINKFVPLDRQGRTFGMQEVLEQAVTIIALLVLGAFSSLAGARMVYLFAPLVVVVLGVGFIRYSYRSVGQNPPRPLEATQALVMGRGLGDPEPLMEGGSAVLTPYDLKPDVSREKRPGIKHAIAVPSVSEKPAKPGKTRQKPPGSTVGSRLMTRTLPPPQSAPAIARPNPTVEPAGVEPPMIAPARIPPAVPTKPGLKANPAKSNENTNPGE